MCSGCARVWSFLHVSWSVLYVSCGAAQLVAGIFFLLAVPSFVLGCNLVAGLWNIFMGIGIGMVACCGRVSPTRQESLLYMIISILIIDTANAIISEWGFYTEDLPKLLVKHQYNILLHYASCASRLATAAVILISFVDSQLTFCSMQTTRSSLKKKNNKKKKNLRGSHEQVSDIEYIIPRAKTTKPQVYNAYTQSWVFDADVGGASSGGGNTFSKLNNSGKSPASDARAYHLKLPSRQDVIITPRPAHHYYLHQKGLLPSSSQTGDLENGVIVIADTEYLIEDAIATPLVKIEQVVVHDDDVNGDADGDDGSHRKLSFMKSFSRSPSPAVLSATSSQLSLNHINHVPAIYDCLERLTQPETFRSRLNSAKSNDQDTQQKVPSTMVVRRGDLSPQIEPVQYASLMKELHTAIHKKEGTAESTTTTSVRKNSDAEFSKELEAALQLIQDLESPPGGAESSEEVAKSTVGSSNSISRSDSEKTLSAHHHHVATGTGPIVTHTKTRQPPTTLQPDFFTFDSKPKSGKGARTVVVQSSDSQSTSGYSSPTHHHHHLNHHLHHDHDPYNNKQNNEKQIIATESDCKTCLSARSSLNDLRINNNTNSNTLAYTIHNTKSTAVISLFTPPTDGLKKGKSITLVNITGDNRPVTPESKKSATTTTTLRTDENKKQEALTTTTTITPNVATSFASSWNVKSLLRRKSKRLSSASNNIPPIQMCPELEGAIVKSESLAYLTEIELLARHQRNAKIQRQIEQRVQQQLGTPWIDELNGV